MNAVYRDITRIIVFIPMLCILHIKPYVSEPQLQEIYSLLKISSSIHYSIHIYTAVLLN